MNKISNKLSYYAATTDPLNNSIYSGYSRNKINMCSNSIVNFLQNNISLGLWSISHIDEGDKYAPNLQYLANNSWCHILPISNI